MRKAFVAVVSGAEVDDSKDQDLRRLTRYISENTLIVETPDCRGEAVIVAEKIITSLFLVRNFRMVKLISPLIGELPGVVARRDEKNFIAELEPAFTPKKSLLGRNRSFMIAPPRPVGEPLLAQDAKQDRPQVVVLSMSYAITACERREMEIWKIMPKLPIGLVGSGLWDINGRFCGVSLATKKPYHRIEDEMILSLPADTVMDFVETH